MAVFTDLEERADLRLAGEGVQGRADRQRAGLVELRLPPPATSKKARSRSTAPCSAGRRWNWTAVSRRGRCPATATTSSGSDLTSAARRVRRCEWVRGRRGEHQPDRGGLARRSGALGRDVRPGRRRRRSRRRPRARGTVLAPPFDAPWVRMTVIADPQGASFVASKFVPENKDLGSRTSAAVEAA